jgi:hypothetical protein
MIQLAKVLTPALRREQDTIDPVASFIQVLHSLENS